MEAYTIEAITAILVHVPAMQDLPTFQGLWDRQQILQDLLCMIKHPDHPIEGMTDKIMKPEAFALVFNILWKDTKRCGEFFEDSYIGYH